MIIWGSKARKKAEATGSFYCPSCKDDRNYVVYKWQRYFTLYYIPLFPTETLGSYLLCTGCQGEFKHSILEHTREQIMAAVSPWECHSCNNKNGPSEGSCVSCGLSRVVAEVAA